MAANKCHFSLQKYVRSKILSRSIKLLLYKTLLRFIRVLGTDQKGRKRSFSVRTRNTKANFLSSARGRMLASTLQSRLYYLYKNPNIIKTGGVGDRQLEIEKTGKIYFTRLILGCRAMIMMI